MKKEGGRFGVKFLVRITIKSQRSFTHSFELGVSHTLTSSFTIVLYRGHSQTTLSISENGGYKIATFPKKSL